MNKTPHLSIGSLFDGIGGFPYAASFFGIKPLWASEILPSAISVTHRHFPEMEHVGDITKLDGGKLPPVDIICFGSPCQGLSAAGKRKGLADPRSGLFMEAIRIINEMREATNGRYPTWAIWENVPGALSSNKGLDFRAVLEAFTEAEIPLPRSGRWANSGMVRGGRADVAWVIYNSQYFGTAQRRRRIFLVCDFGAGRAAEILFVPKSLQRYFEAGGTPRQGPAAYASRSVDGAASRGANLNDIAATIFAGYGNHWNGNAGAYDGGNFVLSDNADASDAEQTAAITLRMRDGCAGGGKGPLMQVEKSGTLATGNDQYLFEPKESNCVTPWDVQSRRVHEDNGVWPALYAGEGGGHGYVAAAEKGLCNPNCLNPWETQQLRVFTDNGASPTLAGADGGGGRNPGGLALCYAPHLVCAAFLGSAGKAARSIGYSEKVSPTLKSGAPCVCEPKPIDNQSGEGSIVPGGCTEPYNAAFVGAPSPSSYGIEYSENATPTLKPLLSGIPCLCEPKLARTLTARGDSSPCADRGQNIVAMPSAPDGKQNAEILEDLPATLTCYQVRSAAECHEQPIICKAVGVHQNQIGDINIADKAYTLNTNGNATGRNSPLVCTNVHAFSIDSSESNSMKSKNPLSGCREVETARTLDTSNPSPTKNQGGIAVVEVHPKISGTLCASGAGLSRPGGMASETDLCVVVPDCGVIPIHDKATRHSGGGETRNDDGAGNGLGIGKEGGPAPTITAGDRHAVGAYCLAGNMIGRNDKNGPNGSGIMEDKSFTLTATDIAAVAATFNRQRCDLFRQGSVAGTQTARQCKDATDLICEKAAAVDCRNYKEIGDLSGTLQAKNAPGYSLNFQNPVRTGYIVRRLTPTECERLQGYPDGWTEVGHDGKLISDTARYMMLGNSVAVPCVAYILMGIAEISK